MKHDVYVYIIKDLMVVLYYILNIYLYWWLLRLLHSRHQFHFTVWLQSLQAGWLPMGTSYGRYETRKNSKNI